MAFLPSGATGSGDTGMDALTIGSVTFLDEECPGELSFGLAQALSVQVLIGGSRTIQALGPNPEDVTWTGKLFAGNVQPRLAALKAMEVVAQPVSLTYLDQSYSVLIKKFTPKYQHRWLGDYTITVTILADNSGQYTQTPPPGIDQQVDGISAAAQATLDQLSAIDAQGTFALQEQFNLLFAAIEVAGILSQITGPNLQSLLTLVNNSTGAAQNYLNALGPNGDSQQFILASQLVAYSQLIGRNLQAGQAPAVAVQQGGDLFTLASQTYGDPTQGFALAAANGLITPILSATQIYQIVLPPLGPSGQFS